MSSRRLPEELEGRIAFNPEHLDAVAATQFLQRLPDVSIEFAGPPLPAVNVDDPQKGQWGGKKESNGRQLTAAVADQASGWFLVVLTVAGSGGSPLVGEVEFHLHPSFHPSIVYVPTRDDRATLKFPAWGAFTVGVSADEGRTQLELDLAQLPDAPELFRSR